MSAPRLDDVQVRVWAELGRAELLASDAAALPSGAIVELDRRPEDPVDVYVNGRRLGTGRLVVVDGTDWAVRLETVDDQASTSGPGGR